jgi:hypothetical protein
MEFPCTWLNNVKKIYIYKSREIQRFIKNISFAAPCTLVTPWGAPPLHPPMQRPWLLPYDHATAVPSVCIASTVTSITFTLLLLQNTATRFDFYTKAIIRLNIMSRSRTICLKLRDTLAEPMVKYNNDKLPCQINHTHCGPTGREQRNVPPRPHLPKCPSSKGNDRWPKAVISGKTAEYQIQMKGKFWFWCGPHVSNIRRKERMFIKKYISYMFRPVLSN